MIVKVTSSAIIGIDSYPVEVEVDISRGLPQFSTVGLPDVTVKESKERIKAAIKNSGYEFPQNHVTVNLAPADIKKEGTGFDLPIAVAILKAEGILESNATQDYLFLGELSLDGSVKGVHGILSAACLAKEMKLKGIIVPAENATEAAMVESLHVIAVNRLSGVVNFLRGEEEINPTQVDILTIFNDFLNYAIDFSDIRGQDHAKRALEVAAAGGHNIIMIGPPGAGKTMLAQRLPTILPDLTFSEAVEVTKIFSVAGLLDKKRTLLATRPFRSPHHTISDAGLVGGGHIPKPGEISLAHNGVLFLDEMPEFKKNVLEALRQPMEDGSVTITRSSMTISYPSRFILVGAMNPCPCGYYGDTRKTCRCGAQQIRQYQAKISGPLLDRIDIHIEVPSVRYKDIIGKYSGESSKSIKGRIDEARAIQNKRFFHQPILCNAQMTEKHLKTFCKLDEESQKLIEMAIDKLGLSARAYTKILKVSRTIADMEKQDSIRAHHVSEAIQYRTLDRGFI